jgi:glucosamine--fructose-6-phosphate aminotransferase (isomerizing)
MTLRQDVPIAEIAGQFRKACALAVLGEKLHWPIALETALKLKETAYIAAEGFAAREFRHGPLAIVKKDYPCLIFAPEDSVYRDNIRLMQEIKHIGGRVIAAANEEDKKLADIAHDIIILPKTLEMFAPILSAIAAQLLAYHAAVSKGIKVDSPRHLKKVTN